MTERIVAVDIDLRQFAAWDSQAGTVCCEEPRADDLYVWLGLVPIGGRVDTILIECASPMLYRSKIHRSTLSWLIYNSSAVTYLVHDLGMRYPHLKILVSPSSTWTKGLSEPIRHKLAGVVEPKYPRKKGRHDLKECQAMIWTYQNEPALWQPLETYLETL